MTGHFQPIDELEQRVQSLVVDGEATHDRMEVEAEEVKVLDRMPRFLERRSTFQRVHRGPALQNRARVPIA